MRQITLHIPNNKYHLFVQFAKEIPFIKKMEEVGEEDYTPLSKKQILDGLKEAVEEMNLITKGKLKARDVKYLINEL